MSRKKKSENDSTDDLADSAKANLPDHDTSGPAPIQSNNAILKALEATLNGIKILFKLANYAVFLWIAGIILLAVYYAFFSGKDYSTKSLLVTKKLEIKNYEKIYLLNNDKAELSRILTDNGIQASELVSELERSSIFFLNIGKPQTKSYEDFTSLLKRSDLDLDTFNKSNCALLKNETNSEAGEKPVVYYILFKGSSDRLMFCINSFLNK